MLIHVKHLVDLYTHELFVKPEWEYEDKKFREFFILTDVERFKGDRNVYIRLHALIRWELALQGILRCDTMKDYCAGCACKSKFAYVCGYVCGISNCIGATHCPNHKFCNTLHKSAQHFVIEISEKLDLPYAEVKARVSEALKGKQL